MRIYCIDCDIVLTVKKARCPICGKNLSTTYGYRKHVDNCRIDKSIRDSDKILKDIKRRNKLR